MILLYIIISIIVIEFVVNEVLNQFNLKHELKPINTILSCRFSFSKRKRAHLYHLVNSRLGIYSGFVSLIVVVSMLYFLGFATIDYWVRHYTTNEIFVGLLFLGVITSAGAIIGLPWSIFQVFYIENRFGFNRQTISSFLSDKLKGALLSLVIGGALYVLISWIYYNFTSSFWWMAWVVITAFSLFMTMFYSTLIVPLFNKQLPLEVGELRQAIEDIAAKAGFSLHNIFVIDGSKRSSKANAYFAGLGHKKRIVLYDTLINQLSIDEIVAVLAHEVGHYKKRHVYLNLIFGIVQTGFILAMFDYVLSFNDIYIAIGAVKPSLHMGLLVFSFLFTPVSSLLNIVTNGLSRQTEYQADKYAFDLGYGAALQSALIKLTDMNLSNINPHPVYVFINYSHPPVNDRLNNLQALK